MSATISPSPLLRAALAVDSLASGIMGVGLAFGSVTLTTLLGLPQPLLLGIGIICLGWAAITGLLARRSSVNRTAILAVIMLNAIWVVQSLVLLASGWVSPNSAGVAFVIAQAIAVAAFAEAQFIGLRRASSAKLAPV